jgi:hypothetical protein
MDEWRGNFRLIHKDELTIDNSPFTIINLQFSINCNIQKGKIIILTRRAERPERFSL